MLTHQYECVTEVSDSASSAQVTKPLSSLNTSPQTHSSATGAKKRIKRWVDREKSQIEELIYTRLGQPLGHLRNLL